MKDGKLLKELEAERKRNFKSNLEFVRFSVAWLKSKSNKEWSEEQKRLIESAYPKKKGRKKIKV